ncbi:MAG: hypothetical protein R2711_05285 [Acidimicrobiales bacterium]
MSTRPTQKIATLAAGILITLSTTAAGCSSATDAGSAQAVAKHRDARCGHRRRHAHPHHHAPARRVRR